MYVHYLILALSTLIILSLIYIILVIVIDDIDIMIIDYYPCVISCIIFLVVTNLLLRNELYNGNYLMYYTSVVACNMSSLFLWFASRYVLTYNRLD